MPIFTVGAAGTSDSGFNIDNSLRFNNPSDDTLSRTQTAGDRQTYTFSVWIKRAKLGVYLNVMGTNSEGECLRLESDNALTYFFNGSSSGFIKTTQLFRDVSSWYHIVAAVDTTQATASNRVKIYVNGQQITSFSSETYPSLNQENKINQNSETFYVGNGHAENASREFDGYMSEVVMIDGQQLDPTSFGEFDEDSGIWKPIDVSGLTFGTNGFYLDFENSGSLGADVSGNGNNFTVNNLTAIDQTTDTPTNNFNTLNALSNPINGYTLSNGNLEATVSGQSFTRTYIASTIAPETGKWYWESKLITSGGSDRSSIGICSYDENIGTGTTIPQNELSICTGYSRIRFTENGSTTEVDSFYTVPSANDIFMYALDLDNTKYYFGINGVWWNYNTAETGGDPTSGSGYVTNSTNIIKGAMSAFLRVDAGAAATTFTNQFNFGSPPYAISSGNSDGKGHGNFEYAVPSGYYALNTKNLAEFG